MNKEQALERMVPPGQRRKNAYLGGIIQIHVTRACDLACLNCTQGSNFGGKTYFMPPDLFEIAVKSLKDYFGVVGVFGGNPAMSPHFEAYCKALQAHIPFERRGLWCNNPKGKGKLMAATFNPAVSNLNVHMSVRAYDEFKRDWPTSLVFGLQQDSRHSPIYVAMKDVLKNGEEYDASTAWDLIANCDINQKWSAMIGMFRGQLRGWFCEIAGAQSILHQDDENYPDTGYPITATTGHYWWQLGMSSFENQVEKHCHECGVPLRGYGELSQSLTGREQISATHANIANPKKLSRVVEQVTRLEQIGLRRIRTVTNYMENGSK